MTLTATDAGGASDYQAFVWTVAAPVAVTDPGTQSGTEGIPFSLQMEGTDGSPLTWSATGLPPGLGIDPTTGLITGTPLAGDAATGAFIATITAADGNGSSANQTVVWSIASAVTFTNPGPQSSSEGAAVSVAVPATDPLGTLKLSATGLPPGLGIDPNTGTITGAAAPGAAASGPYTVTVTASDGTYSGSTSLQWNVVAGPVSMADPQQQTSTEGAAVSLPIHADGAALLYTAEGLPPGLKLNPTGGLISGVIPAGAAASGPYTVTVTATDANGYSASQTFQWNILAAVTLTDPDQQSGVEGAAVDLRVQTTDAEGGSPTFAAQGLPAGLVVNPATGAITGTLLAGDAAAGPYTVTVTASDGTYSASQTFQWDVAAAVTMTDLDAQFNTEGDQVNVQVGAPGGSLTFGATGLPAGLAIDPTTGLISGTVAAGAAASQPYSVTVTATDANGYSASQTIAWAVDPSAPSAPSYGDTAALDAALAALVQPGQGGFGDLVYQPAQDGPTFGDLVYRPGQAGRAEVVPVSARLRPPAGGGIFFQQPEPAEEPPDVGLRIYRPDDPNDPDGPNSLLDQYYGHDYAEILRRMKAAQEQTEIDGLIAQERDEAKYAARIAGVPQKVIDQLLAEDDQILRKGSATAPGVPVNDYGNLAHAAVSYGRLGLLRAAAIEVGIAEADVDQIIKDAEADHPLDPVKAILKQLDEKHQFTKRSREKAAPYLYEMMRKEFPIRPAAAQELNQILHGDASDGGPGQLTTANQVLAWVETQNLKAIVSDAVQAAKFETKLNKMAPRGAMVWIWMEHTANGDTPKVSVQIGVGTKAVGDKYVETIDRIALAFIKIDKKQVKKRDDRDPSTGVNDQARNWVQKINGWEHDAAGHAIGARVRRARDARVRQHFPPGQLGKLDDRRHVGEGRWPAGQGQCERRRLQHVPAGAVRLPGSGAVGPATVCRGLFPAAGRRPEEPTGDHAGVFPNHLQPEQQRRQPDQRNKIAVRGLISRRGAAEVLL